MNYETQKVSKIANVMIDFYLSLSAKKLNISIDEKNDKFIIEVNAEQVDCKNKKIQELIELLHAERHRDIEEYYWQLVGNDIEIEEINLLGMMVDEATVEYECPLLKVRLVRYK